MNGQEGGPDFIQLAALTSGSAEQEEQRGREDQKVMESQAREASQKKWSVILEMIDTAIDLICGFFFG